MDGGKKYCNQQCCRKARKKQPSDQAQRPEPLPEPLPRSSPREKKSPACTTAGNSTQILFVEPNFVETPSEYETFYDCSSDNDLAVDTSGMSKVLKNLEDPEKFRGTLKKVVCTSHKLLKSFDEASKKKKPQPCILTMNDCVQKYTGQGTVGGLYNDGDCNAAPYGRRYEPITFTIPVTVQLQYPASSDMMATPLPSGMAAPPMEPIRTSIVAATRAPNMLLASDYLDPDSETGDGKTQLKQFYTLFPCKAANAARSLGRNTHRLRNLPVIIHRPTVVTQTIPNPYEACPWQSVIIRQLRPDVEESCYGLVVVAPPNQVVVAPPKPVVFRNPKLVAGNCSYPPTAEANCQPRYPSAVDMTPQTQQKSSYKCMHTKPSQPQWSAPEEPTQETRKAGKRWACSSRDLPRQRNENLRAAASYPAATKEVQQSEREPWYAERERQASKCTRASAVWSEQPLQSDIGPMKPCSEPQKYSSATVEKSPPRRYSAAMEVEPATRQECSRRQMALPQPQRESPSGETDGERRLLEKCAYCGHSAPPSQSLALQKVLDPTQTSTSQRLSAAMDVVRPESRPECSCRQMALPQPQRESPSEKYACCGHSAPLSQSAPLSVPSHVPPQKGPPQVEMLPEVNHSCTCSKVKASQPKLETPVTNSQSKYTTINVNYNCGCSKIASQPKVESPVPKSPSKYATINVNCNCTCSKMMASQPQSESTATKSKEQKDPRESLLVAEPLSKPRASLQNAEPNEDCTRAKVAAQSKSESQDIFNDCTCSQSSQQQSAQSKSSRLPVEVVDPTSAATELLPESDEDYPCCRTRRPLPKPPETFKDCTCSQSSQQQSARSKSSRVPVEVVDLTSAATELLPESDEECPCCRTRESLLVPEPLSKPRGSLLNAEPPANFPRASLIAEPPTRSSLVAPGSPQISSRASLGKEEPPPKYPTSEKLLPGSNEDCTREKATAQSKSESQDIFNDCTCSQSSQQQSAQSKSSRVPVEVVDLTSAATELPPESDEDCPCCRTRQPLPKPPETFKDCTCSQSSQPTEPTKLGQSRDLKVSSEVVDQSVTSREQLSDKSCPCTRVLGRQPQSGSLDTFKDCTCSQNSGSQSLRKGASGVKSADPSKLVDACLCENPDSRSFFSVINSSVETQSALQAPLKRKSTSESESLLRLCNGTVEKKKQPPQPPPKPTPQSRRVSISESESDCHCAENEPVEKSKPPVEENNPPKTVRPKCECRVIEIPQNPPLPLLLECRCTAPPPECPCLDEELEDKLDEIICQCKATAPVPLVPPKPKRVKYRLASPQHKVLNLCTPCRYDPSPLVDEDGRVFCPYSCGCCLCPWKPRATESLEDQLKHQKIKVCKCRERGDIFEGFSRKELGCSNENFFDMCPCREKAEAKFLEIHGYQMWKKQYKLADETNGTLVTLDEINEVSPYEKSPSASFS